METMSEEQDNIKSNKLIIYTDNIYIYKPVGRASNSLMSAKKIVSLDNNKNNLTSQGTKRNYYNGKTGEIKCMNPWALITTVYTNIWFFMFKYKLFSVSFSIAMAPVSC